MKYHQGIKSEIDTRDKNFTTCIDLGKTLLHRKHHAAAEASFSPHELCGILRHRETALSVLIHCPLYTFTEIETNNSLL